MLNSSLIFKTKQHKTPPITLATEAHLLLLTIQSYVRFRLNYSTPFPYSISVFRSSSYMPSIFFVIFSKTCFRFVFLVFLFPSIVIMCPSRRIIHCALINLRSLMVAYACFKISSDFWFILHDVKIQNQGLKRLLHQNLNFLLPELFMV